MRQTGPTALVVREPSGAPVALRTAAGGTGGPVGTPAASLCFLTDTQGSVLALVRSDGSTANRYGYDPYGGTRTVTEQVANPIRYTGGYLDAATGLYELGIRYYDPTLGRFTQPDPTAKTRTTPLPATTQSTT